MTEPVLPAGPDYPLAPVDTRRPDAPGGPPAAPVRPADVSTAPRHHPDRGDVSQAARR